MIKKETIPVPPWKGLYLDGIAVPGGMSKAENVIILADGTAERRTFERTLAESPVCLASRGLKAVFELQKSSGTRILFADVDNSEGYTSSFGAELVTGVSAIGSWTDPADWSYGSSKWTHAGTGATPLVGLPTVTASTMYRLVVDVTCPVPAATSEWVYAHTDSTYDWTTKDGNKLTVWLNTWTHDTNGTADLTCADFTPAIGSSYVVKVGITHTSGTGISIAMGGITIATNVAASGFYTYIVRYCTSVARLTFTPSNDWRGSINKSFPRFVQQLPNAWVSVVKLVDPAGPDHPSNYDYTASTYTPKSTYMNGAELTYSQPLNWYPAAAAYSGQSLAVSLGGTAAGTITASGVYSYDVTTAAATTTAVTFTPTTAWSGSINSCSIMAMTQASAATKTKVIGGTVTGTTSYETSWVNILTDLTSSAAIRPQWTALQDRAFRVDGTNKNYWFDDATAHHSLGCPAPTDAPITASTTGGEMTAGDYNVYYTYVKKYGSGSSQYVVKGNPSPAAHTTVAGNAISVSVISCTEADVNYIRIYRTLYNEPGSDAYLDQEISNTTKTVTLISADDVIGDGEVLEYNHDMPPIFKYVLGAGSRLWGVDSSGTLWWSILDNPEIVPYYNFMTFDPKDGDVSMGIIALKKHILYFKKRRTWMLDMFSENVAEDGTVSLSKDIVSTNLGCTASGSAQSVGADSAIWLSHAGFILYDGGTMRNISGGDPNTGIPGRIQSVIDDFMFRGAENYITSAYQSKRHLYHVNFIYKTGESITSQRHFVYNLNTDTWTEFVYRSDSQVKYYETNLAVAHDSYGNEVILIPYLTTADGTVTYIFQNEYDEPFTGLITTAIMGNDPVDGEYLGGTGTQYYGGVYTLCDSSDNVYVLNTIGNLFKITSADVASCLVTVANMAAQAWPTTVTPTTDFTIPLNFVSDVTNSRMFVQYRAIWSPSSVAEIFAPDGQITAHGIFKITTAGVITKLSMDTLSGSYVHTKLIGMASGVLYVLTWDNYEQSTAPTYFRLSSMNVTSGALTTIYSFTGITQAIAAKMDKAPFVLYSDDLYYFYDGNLYVVSDIDGTPALTTYATTIDSSEVAVDIHVDSASKIYLITTDAAYVDYKLYCGILGESTWTFSEIKTNAVNTSDNYHYATNWASRHYMLHENTAGQYAIEEFTEDGGAGFGVYDEDMNVEYTALFATNRSAIGLSWRIGTIADESVYFICTNAGETVGVYRYIPDIYWQLVSESSFDVTLALAGTAVNIVSNYEGLGLSENKRIGGAYLDTTSQYATVGRMALEPNYNINQAVHVNNEAAEPSGSVSRLPFSHPGQQTWNTTSSFDGAVEAWRTHRIDIGVKGQSFRYNIQLGDYVGGGHGVARIRPPRLIVQVLPLP